MFSGAVQLTPNIAYSTTTQAQWMNEEKDMTDRIVGGNVFEFTTERIHVEGESTFFVSFSISMWIL